MADVLRWVLIGISIPLFVLMVMYTVRRARELDSRIDEFHAEQEAAKNQPGPIDPYQRMAEVFGHTDPAPTTKTQDPTPGAGNPR